MKAQPVPYIDIQVSYLTGSTGSEREERVRIANDSTTR